MPDHPLNKYWPKGFEGTFEDYTNFSVPVDPQHYLLRKPLMFKSQWVNAVLFTHGLLYNFWIRKWIGLSGFGVCWALSNHRHRRLL